MKATTWLEALRWKGAALGSSATMRAATRVNVEQASKRSIRKPIHLSDGEANDMSPGGSAGVLAAARMERETVATREALPVVRAH